MLNSASLYQEILAVYLSGPPSAAVSAKKLSSAYDTYAKGAQAGIALPIFIGTEKEVMASTLLAAMNPRSGNPTSFATAWATALTSFWTTPPVVFSDGVNTGPALAVPGSAALKSSLEIALANARQSAPQAAQTLATALDVATRTITITLAPSGATFPLL